MRRQGFACMQGIDIHIDRLTRSVIDQETGTSYRTVVLPVDDTFINTYGREIEFVFDWGVELKNPNRKVFKVVLADQEHITLGMISLEITVDHIFVHLVERGGGHKNSYLGVGGNLFAYACKFAFDLGMRGHVAFIPKTKLIQHFSVTLGTIVLLNGRMGILEDAARRLIEIYFPDETPRHP